MKYAIIYKPINLDRYYLKGFTNQVIDNITISGHTFTTELRELSGLFIPLEADAKVYLTSY